MKNYTQHPFARLDNNVAERAVRPLAIGRRNWLFFGSPEGGEAGAILFSLVQTCRGVNWVLDADIRGFFDTLNQGQKSYVWCSLCATNDISYVENLPTANF